MSISTRSLLLGMSLTLGFASAPAFAEDQKASDTAPLEDLTGLPLSGFLSTSVYSSYVFRGLTLYDGVSIQPSVGLYYDMGDYGRLGSTLWMQIPGESSEDSTVDLTTGADLDELFAPQAKFVELDPTISYDIGFDPVNISVGHTWYTDPQEGDVDVIFPFVDETTGEFISGNFRTSRGDTAEFYAAIAVDMILNPEFTFVHDYRTYDYEYYTLGFSQEFMISKEKEFGVKPFVRFAFSSGNESSDDPTEPTAGFYDENGLVHVDLGISASVKIDNVTIKPVFTYVFVEDDFLGDDDVVWAGFDINYAI